MKKEYLKCPNCSEGQIYLMEVSVVDRGFYICSNCDLVWDKYRELHVSWASKGWHQHLPKRGISPSNRKVTKEKPLVIVEEENSEGNPPLIKKDYLLCPVCGHGVIHRMCIKGLKGEIDACEECDMSWIKGTALQGDGVGLLDEYIKEKGFPTKVEITKRRRLVIMEEDHPRRRRVI